MKATFLRREPGQIEFGLIYGTIVLLALVAARLLPIPGLVPDCAFRAVTGFPCPTCGSTRALINLSQARILPAFAMNPLASFSLSCLMLAFFYGLIAFIFKVPRFHVTLSEEEKDRARKAVLLIVLLNWLYLFFAL